MSAVDDWKGKDRRKAERKDLAYKVQLQVEVYGEQGSRPFYATGETVNISLVGCLALVDDRIAPGARCTVKFVEPDERVKPAWVRGVVVRSEREDEGEYQVAVEFDDPLVVLEPGD